MQVLLCDPQGQCRSTAVRFWLLSIHIRQSHKRRVKGGQAVGNPIPGQTQPHHNLCIAVFWGGFDGCAAPSSQSFIGSRQHGA